MRNFIIIALIMLPIAIQAQDEPSFKPQLFGTIKTDFEADLYDGYTRFIVQNARAGLKGKINGYAGYQFQLDVNAAGKLSVLDAYGELYPGDRWKVMFGQMSIPFADSYIITPGQYMFTSMSFVYPYASARARDIGLRADYVLHKGKLPVEIQAGLYNGEGTNNPQWTESPSVAARLVVGEMKQGFRGTAKFYGDFSDHKRVNIYGMALRYAEPKWAVEAEWNTCDSADVSSFSLTSVYLQGSYKFFFKKTESMFKYAMPTARVETMGNKVLDHGYSISRMTLGANFGFDTRPLTGELRLNVEKYFSRSDIAGKAPAIFEGGRLLHDKIILELLINF